MRSSEARQADSPSDYTWPVRLIQVFIVQVYFFSGYSKLVYSGWRWASSTNIRNWLLYFSETDETRAFHSLGMWIAARPFLCGAIGVGTLLLELGLCIVLFSKPARRLLVPLIAIFHLGILLSMNLTFLNVPQLLVFADWSHVENWVRIHLKRLIFRREFGASRQQA
jgi:hypothetical protein